MIYYIETYGAYTTKVVISMFKNLFHSVLPLLLSGFELWCHFKCIGPHEKWPQHWSDCKSGWCRCQRWIEV